ncbi:MAG: isoamylase early set domain-containing protein [Candidatus Promineifilaceae bacterium]|jgi:1,4-alpha-glucan branching enzyme
MINKKFFKTKDECEVTFEYANEGASEVALVSNFNDWEPVPMTKASKAGSPFRVKVRMPKGGEYQFRYQVDGSYWANDEDADAYWPNEFGETNGVVNTNE